MSTSRTYQDGCSIARALDVVGERWALLVVRELVLGPQRFSDLRRSLPGASSNVVADRLRELEGRGVLRRRLLPAPAPSRVYELTDAGRTEAQASAERAPSGPWGGGDHPARELGDEAKRLMSAFRNVVRTANKEQSERAVAILRDARKQLYQLLAED